MALTLDNVVMALGLERYRSVELEQKIVTMAEQIKQLHEKVAGMELQAKIDGRE